MLSCQDAQAGEDGSLLLELQVGLPLWACHCGPARIKHHAAAAAAITQFLAASCWAWEHWVPHLPLSPYRCFFH